MQGLLAARRVAVRLRLGDGGLTEQINGRGNAAPPQPADGVQRVGRIGPDNESPSDSPDSESRGRRSDWSRGRQAQGTSDSPRDRRVIGFQQELLEMSDELGAAPTRRTHIDEAEHGGAQRGIGDQSLHGPPLCDSHRSAAGFRQQLSKFATRRPNPRLELVA
jgi:hypothetical protein